MAVVQGRAKHAGRFGHFQSAAGAESLQEVAVVVRRVVPDTFDSAACDVGDGPGPWTGPRSTKQFTAAATVLDAALWDRLLQEERIHYMSMLFKPQRFGKPSREELRIQSKSDLVRMRCLY